ncbi:MAG: polysaccharide biosynthesis/export family protein [Bacteroidia bacterium]|nr:polysaccharide biosynthesis/export family protein [Bacteroidia bacterium]HQV00946.1 polysaccharide biosynthesis/export family protein [Bacteroidia bacterium]
MRKLIVIIAMLSCSGCYINSSVMFKTPKNYPYSIDQTIGNLEYRIAPNDIIEFSIYNNDGYKLIEPMMATTTTTSAARIPNDAVNDAINFTVDVEGYVRLPQIGKVKIKDLTKQEAEKLVEEKYAIYYKNPFSIITVINRRVMVFTGTGGRGTVVNLKNENTTLIEALAAAGGVTETGKAYKIKLVRGDTRNPQIMLIDLSTVEGLKQSNLLLQANDIIYVEPTPQISQGILKELAPIMAIISSVVVVAVFIRTL